MSFTNFITTQRLSALITLALLTVGAYSAVALFYQIVGLQIQPSQAMSQTVPSTPASDIAFVQPASYYSPILERDLFKIKTAAPAPAQAARVDLENLEQTRLNLKLWGTVSGDPEKAYAVIEDTQKREQNLFRVGDSIQSATLKMILREKVVLNVEGRDEVLSMEEIAQSSAMLTASRGRPQVYARPPAALPPAGEQRITLQRSMLDESFADVNKLMTQIAISPNTEDGESAGLSLSRIAPDSIFRRMGLRNGDVLLGVNGQPILSTEDAMRMYESLKSSNEVQLQLKRRGQERTINYSIR